MSVNTSAVAPQREWLSDWLSDEQFTDVPSRIQSDRWRTEKKFRYNDTSTVRNVSQVATELVMAAVSSSRNSTSTNRYFLLALPRLVQTKIGWKAARRLRRFRKYDDGWCGGASTRLSSGSEVSFFKFLVSFSSFHRRPSIFVSREGLLELAWEKMDGTDISIVFGDHYLEISDERAKESKLFPIGRTDDFRSVWAALS